MLNLLQPPAAKVKRFHRKIAGGVVALAFLAIWAAWSLRETLASRKVGNQQHSWGYKVERYRFREVGAYIEIWHSRGLRLIFNDPDIMIRTIKQERWLSGNRALYLKLDLGVRTDSIVEEIPAEILYDFRRGEVYLSSKANLWREEISFATRDTAWRTEAEFKEMLDNLDR